MALFWGLSGFALDPAPDPPGGKWRVTAVVAIPLATFGLGALGLLLGPLHSIQETQLC